MSSEAAAEVIEAYLGAEGVARVAEDAVYTLMGSGEQARGREAIAALFDRIYREDFDASATVLHRVIANDMAIRCGADHTRVSRR